MKRDKQLLRDLLDAGPHGPLDWKADPHSLSASHRMVLINMAKTIGYRKSVSSSLSLGTAFFMYLCKGMDAPQEKQPGKRWDNDGLANYSKAVADHIGAKPDHLQKG